MSEQIGEGVITIRTDESGVDFDGAGRRAGEGYSKGFGLSLKGLAATIGGVLVAGKALDFAKSAVADARENQKVQAATVSIIKATGSAANQTADDIANLAGTLAAKTGVDDAQIQAGENLLLTFKNVRKEGEGLNDIFGRATQAGLDLAAAGFGSVEGNALQLGKALNDPLKGITALTRSGVTFTEAQKEQIKGFVESNDLLSAQKIILGEVENQVGGTAEATATAGEKAGFAFGEIKESIGTLLLPVLDTLANVFVDQIAPAIAELVAGAGKLGPVFASVGEFISGAFGGDAGGQVSSFFDTIRNAVTTVLPLLRDGFVAVLPSVLAFFDSVRSAVSEVLPVMADTFQNQVLPAVIALGGYLSTNLFPIFQQVAQVVATQIVPAIGQLAVFFYGTLYPAVVDIVTQVGSRLKPVFDQLFETIQTRILPTFQKAVTQIRTQLIPALQPLIVKVVAVAGFLIKLAAVILSVVLPPLLRLAGFIISKVVPALISIVTFAARVVNGLLNVVGAIARAIGSFGRFAGALVSGVGNAISQVVSAIGGLPGKVAGFVGDLVGAGKDLIGGLLRGMGEAARGVGGFIGNLASSVGSAIRDAVVGAINSVIDAANNAIPNSISVPLAPDIDLPDNPIPRLQSGTQRVPYTGTYDVGEVGRERVILPAGARVLTAAQTRQADAAGGIDFEALVSAIVAALRQVPPVTFVLPTGDPEAAAMAAINRLVTA